MWSIFQQRMTRRAAFVAGLKVAMGVATASLVPAVMASTDSPEKVNVLNYAHMNYAHQMAVYLEMLDSANRRESGPLVDEILAQFEKRRIAMEFLKP